MKIQQIATGGLIVRKDGKFLIVRRSLKDDFLPGYWELPGGGSDYGETPQQALQREIQEECALDITIRQPLTTCQYFMEETQRIEIIFFCTLNDEAQELQLSDEHDTSAWVSTEELEKYKMDDFMAKVVQDAVGDLDYWSKKYL